MPEWSLLSSLSEDKIACNFVSKIEGPGGGYPTLLYLMLYQGPNPLPVCSGPISACSLPPLPLPPPEPHSTFCPVLVPFFLFSPSSWPINMLTYITSLYKDFPSGYCLNYPLPFLSKLSKNSASSFFSPSSLSSSLLHLPTALLNRTLTCMYNELKSQRIFSSLNLISCLCHTVPSAPSQRALPPHTRLVSRTNHPPSDWAFTLLQLFYDSCPSSPSWAYRGQAIHSLSLWALKFPST